MVNQTYYFPMNRQILSVTTKVRIKINNENIEYLYSSVEILVLYLIWPVIIPIKIINNRRNSK